MVLNRLFVVVGLTCFATACSTVDQPRDTHYWEGQQATSSADYRLDNQACSSMANAESNEPMASDSLTFQAYKNCMIEKGYVLRTY